MYKTNDEIIKIQAKATAPIQTGVVFWSHDRGTAKLRFKLLNGPVAQNIAEGSQVPIRLEFPSATAEGGKGKHDYLANVEDRVNGIVSIVLADNILGFVGTVTGSIYIDFPNTTSIDTAGRFTFEIRRSPIDENTPEVEDYYFNGWSEIQKELDKKIALTDSEINKLKTKLDDVDKKTNEIKATQEAILKSIAENELATKNDLEQAKQESSANVIDNIASSEIATLKKVFLIDGLGGKAYRESDSGLVDCSANDYTALISDASYIRTEFATAGKVAGFEFYFNVLDVLEKKYTFFKHLNTTAEKVALLKTYVKKHNCTAVLRGGNGSNNGARLALGLNGIANWAGATGWVTSTDFKSNTQNASTTSLLSATGVARFRAYSHTYASDGVTPAWIEVKDIRLIVELEVNGRTIIEEMIAANHVQNLATQAEAEAGTDNTKTMTPLRVFQSIAKWVQGKFVSIAGNETIGGIKNFRDGLLLDGLSVTAGMIERAVTDADSSDTTNVSNVAGKLTRIGNLVFFTVGFKCDSYPTSATETRWVIKIPDGYKRDSGNPTQTSLSLTRNEAQPADARAYISQASMVCVKSGSGYSYVSGIWVTKDAWPS